MFLLLSCDMMSEDADVLPRCCTKQLIIRCALSLSSLQVTGFLLCQSLRFKMPFYCHDKWRHCTVTDQSSVHFSVSKFNKTWSVKRTNFIPGSEPKTSVPCVYVFSREKGKIVWAITAQHIKTQSLSSEFLIKLQPHKDVGVALILRLFEACPPVSLPNEITLIRPTLRPKPTNSVSWTNRFLSQSWARIWSMEPQTITGLNLLQRMLTLPAKHAAKIPQNWSLTHSPCLHIHAAVPLWHGHVEI